MEPTRAGQGASCGGMLLPRGNFTLRESAYPGGKGSGDCARYCRSRISEERNAIVKPESGMGWTPEVSASDPFISDFLLARIR